MARLWGSAGLKGAVGAFRFLPVEGARRTTGERLSTEPQAGGYGAAGRRRAKAIDA
jgi:hypothetical protein